MYGLSGLGQGYIQGLQTRRDHNREDEQDQQRSKLFGLQMRQGEQGLRHAEERHGPQVEGLELGNQRTRQQFEFDAEANPHRLRGFELGNQRTAQAMQHADAAERRDQQMHGFSMDRERFGKYERDMSMNYQVATRFLANGRIPEFQEVYNRFLPEENQIEAMAPTDNGFMVRYGGGDEEELSMPEIGERLRIMGQPEAWMEETFGPQEAGGPGGVGSTEARRVMDAVRNRVDKVFQTHLGAEFIGNPRNASLHSMASQVAADVSTMLYQNGMPFVPDSIGAYAADLVLGGRIPGLSDEDAMEIANEELGTGWRGASEEERVARAREIQQEAQQQLYQAVFERSAGEAQQTQVLGQRAFLPQGDTEQPVRSDIGAEEFARGRAERGDSPARLETRDPNRGLTLPEGDDGPSMLLHQDRARERGHSAGLLTRDILGHLQDAPTPHSVIREPARGARDMTMRGLGSAARGTGGFFSGLFSDSAYERTGPLRDLSRTLQEGDQPTAKQVQKVQRYIEQNPRTADQMNQEDLNLLESLFDALDSGEFR